MTMTFRERFDAIMHYKPYDKLPIVHFGFWNETIERWQHEGHLTAEEAQPFLSAILPAMDGTPEEARIAEKLGFDHNYSNLAFTVFIPWPFFEPTVIEVTPDGFEKRLNWNGVIELHRGDAGSIPAEVDHTLKDRESWEKIVKPRMQFSEERVMVAKAFLPRIQELQELGQPVGLFCGSLFGQIRDMMGIVGLSYLQADDRDLFVEILENQGELCYQNTKAMLEAGVEFDFAHFWEDICFKNGPLVNPRVFEEHVGKNYRRIVDLVNSYGIDIVSLDCDGKIDELVPIWLDNGVNTMFPIEVGTWNASIAPWREQYGKELRGVGGVRKYVFALDYAAVDEEIERLKPLVELGGYLPCPDHRIPPDAKWEVIQYYCEQMHEVFG
jgi:uroporphyrinogen decarboxylase